MFETISLLPGVNLRCRTDPRFKQGCLSLHWVVPMCADHSAMNALIPFVLRRCATGYEDMEKISARLDELYGTAIEPVVRRIGEIQCVGFFASIPEGDFLPGKENVLRPACDLLGRLLLSPATRGGLLLPQYVDSEKEKLLDIIRSRINDKRSYAVTRCIEEMCCYEDFAVGRFGSEAEAENINYKKLTRQYRSLLQTSPIEIFYCGRSSKKELVSCLRDVLSTLPRGEIDYDIGTDVRMNALEDKPRTVTEELDVTQGKLVIGYRLGECMEEAEPAPIFVFNCVFGGGTTSKLFMNVRERLQLCYYASSMVSLQKGLLLVASGIEFDKFEVARDEIFRQLDAIRQGHISDEELNSAKSCVASDLRAYTDSQGELEGFYLTRALEGLEYGPMELAELVEDVTKEDVMGIANSLACDMIYFLKGNGQAEEDEDAAE